MSEQGSSVVQCEHEDLSEIHRKLDRLDESIRGNGKPGILIRLDRLEQSYKRQSQLIWLIVGSVVTAIVSMAAAWLQS